MALTAFVTGGSRGIGLAVVKDLLARGYVVATCARSFPPDGPFDTLATEYDGKVFPLVADLRTSASVEDVFVRAYATLGGRIDLLINNAAIYPPFFSAMEDCIALNLTAPMKGTEIVLHRETDGLKKPAERGITIIQVSSMAGGPVAPPFNMVYGAVKAGLNHFTASTKWLHAVYNVTVIAVCPGFTDTEMVAAQKPLVQPYLDATKGDFGIITSAQVSAAVMFALDQRSTLAGRCVAVSEGGTSVMQTIHIVPSVKPRAFDVESIPEVATVFQAIIPLLPTGAMPVWSSAAREPSPAAASTSTPPFEGAAASGGSA